MTKESIKQIDDKIHRQLTLIVGGVRGNGIKFDGVRLTRITRDAHSAPDIEGAATFEAWIAPQAYPWNWGAIVERKSRYFFGLDATGHVGLRQFISTNSGANAFRAGAQVPFMCNGPTSPRRSIPVRRGLSLYINGQDAGRLAISGHLDGGGGTFQIGRNLEEIPAASSRKIPASYSFDGIIDELKIHTLAHLNAAEIASAYESSRPTVPPSLTWRKLPRIPDGQKHFGAYYTSLKFYPEWDRLWRIDEYPDLVVTFDDAPYKMVFWHGTNYNMNLITENGRWVGDQSAEAPPGENGCIEHMSDKQARYSHVRLLENSPARIVVHWRYAMTDVLYNIGESDPITGWGDWVDEYYTIYPDGLAVRHFLIHAPRKRYSITEPATLNNPGEKAEDNVSIEAC